MATKPAGIAGAEGRAAALGSVSDFLQAYNQFLENEIAGAGLPPQLWEGYIFESCLAQTEAKELYIVTRRSDGARGLLRVSKNEANEEAAAEAQVLQGLNHPAIPRMLGFWQTPERGYLVREYFEGQPLSRLVQDNGPFSKASVLDTAGALAEILCHIHGQTPPVVHRDIKPQNIIVAPDGTLKLIDFGIARQYQVGNDYDTVYLGTRHYAPPEQFGYAQTGPASDIYALGILLLFVATGSAERRDWRERVTDRQLRSLIEKCIAFDPEARFASAREVLRRVQAIKRGPWLLAATVATGAVALGLCVWLVVLLVGDFTRGPAGLPTGAAAPGISAASRSNRYNPAPSGEVLGYEGNLPGNINNGGLAVQAGEEIFYTDGADIYRMDLDGGNQQQVANLPGAGFLNWYGGYLYCTATNGVYRIEPDTGRSVQLSDALAGYLMIREGQLYFLHRNEGGRLHRMSLDGTGLEEMNDIQKINRFCIVGEEMYFTDETQGYQLYRCRLDGSDRRLVRAHASDWPCELNGKLYFDDGSAGGLLYIDLAAGGSGGVFSNSSGSYLNATPRGFLFTNGVNRYVDLLSPDGESVTSLSDRPAKWLNLAGDWVFYRDATTQDLYRVRLDGTGNTLVSAY